MDDTQADTSSRSFDVEKDAGADYAHLTNTVIQSFSWDNVTVTVKDRQTKQPKDILSGVSGSVKAGEMLALMGPSGSGKTTLLNVLAHREVRGSVSSSLYLNSRKTSLKNFRKLSAYVEQEDALVGSLTVRETLYFAAQLSLPSSISKTERLARITSLLSSFGLQDQSNTLIGTPIRKGVSGGQKRRVSVAASLITSPSILFLDEPTSGLDSAASYEVINFVREIARKHKILVIASIHQPSTTTFSLFDSLLLLSLGKTAYSGPVEGIQTYFSSIGFEMPLFMNPAEYVIQLVNTDFSRDRDEAATRLKTIQDAYERVAEEAGSTKVFGKDDGLGESEVAGQNEGANPLTVPFTLMHRSFIKSYRDFIAYGIRIIMYVALAIMMGTVWLRLGTQQEHINAFTNAIFFGGAFMSFMAVAYIPAYLEDLSLYTKEHSNGLYGPLAFHLANFLTGLPYLFLITVLYSVVAYWLVNFWPTAQGFWMWVLWLFLDLVAAESLVVLLSSLIPIFVVALASVAFANGLWMSVNGFMVPPGTLNPFWKYVFHYIDYQAYVFRGMMVNEFGQRNYECARTSDGGCNCMYPSRLQDRCLIEGKAVLAQYGYGTENIGKYVGYMLVIIVGYRILGWLALKLKK